MLAVGRMHLDAGFLAEAQASLVAAGKANGRDPQPFRFLGEVLLRRGDAQRAEKVLARALQFNPNDAEARLWHDRSVLYSALQKRVGVEAVAAEVLRTLPKQNSIPPPTMQSLSHKPFGNEELTKPRGQNPFSNLAADESALPRFDSEESLRISEADLIEESSPRLSPLASAARATTLGIGPPGPKLPGLGKGPVAARPNPLAAKAAVVSKAPGLNQPVALAKSASRSQKPALSSAPTVRADGLRAPKAGPEGFEEVITTVTPAPFVAPSWPQSPPAARAPLPPLSGALGIAPPLVGTGARHCAALVRAGTRYRAAAVRARAADCARANACRAYHERHRADRRSALTAVAFAVRCASRSVPPCAREGQLAELGARCSTALLQRGRAP